MRTKHVLFAFDAFVAFACACALALAMSVTAFATEADSGTATGTVECSNGWALSYTASGDEATVTGVERVGSGELVVPSTAKPGVEITSLGSYSLSPSSSASNPNANKADALLKALQSVKLPDTVVSMQDHVFFDATNLTSIDVGKGVADLSTQVFARTGISTITLPATVTGVNYQDFLGCQNLETVLFEGDTLGYIGRYAFSGCTALKRLDIPMLTSYPPADIANQNSNFRINNGAFYGCSALEELVFLGDTNFKAYKYFESPACLTGCKDDLKLVYYCGEDSFTGEGKGLRTNTYDRYYSVDFYASKSDAETSTNRIASVTYPASTLQTDLSSGKVDVATAFSAQRSVVPLDALAEGQVWAFDPTRTDYQGIISEGAPACRLATRFTGSMVAYPVDAVDLDHAYLTSPEIEALARSTTNSSLFGESIDVSDPATYYMTPKAGGAAPVNNLSVVAADGETVIDPQFYSISFQKRSYDSASRTYSFKDISADEITDAGMYRAVATGAPSTYAEGTTAVALFYVKNYELTETSIAASSAYETAGKASLAAAANLGENAYFTVVAPRSSWQLSLVATSLAGVGNSIAVFSDNDYATADESSAFQAIIQAGALSTNGIARKNVFVLGTDAQVSPAYRNRINEVRGTTSGLTSFNQATPQELSLTVYDTIKKFGKGGSSARYPYCWGNTAIIVSASKSYGALPIGELAYKAQAPVFFAEGNGSVSQQVLERLAAGGFSKVIIAGDESYVSKAAFTAVKKATGKAPTRLLDSSLQACVSARDLADYLTERHGASVSSVVLVKADDPASVFAADQLAAISNGVVFPLASTADAKFVQQYLEGVDDTVMKQVYYIGAPDSIDPKLSKRINAIGTRSALSTDVSSGDTFECEGYVYKLNSGNKAVYQACVKTSESATYAPAAVQLNGKAITVTGYDNTAFMLDGVSKVVVDTALCNAAASNLFQGNSQVRQVVIQDANNAAFKLPASYFKGCAKLKTVVLPAKTTAIGASAFQGCKALTKLSLSSTVLKSIGKSAFQGCKKLKALSIASTKLTSQSVGADAFSGVNAKATVSVPKTKVSAYEKLFKARGLAQTATVKSN